VCSFGQAEETFTPRLVLIDSRNGLGILSPEGNLYHAKESPTGLTTWCGYHEKLHGETDMLTVPHRDGSVERCSEDAPRKSAFLEYLDAEAACPESPPTPPSEESIESSIYTWSDYLKVHLHPRTVLSMSSWEDSFTDGELSVSHFKSGEAMAQHTLFRESFEEKLRFFAEECDYLQGFHFGFDASSMFSGVGIQTAMLLKDEYPRTPTWILPILEPSISASSVRPCMCE
jgi:hypothetical protein